MLVKLLRNGRKLACYFTCGLAVQLLLLQAVVASGVSEKRNNETAPPTRLSNLMEAILIEGKVVDEEGNPIPGAAILVKGTTSGTSTDIDGNFSLDVPDGAVLVVSFLGFIPQEIDLGNQTDLEIKLVEDIAQMDEVVVVGFGTQKKSHLTAAVEQIGSDLIENRPINRLSEALQGLWLACT